MTIRINLSVDDATAAEVDDYARVLEKRAEGAEPVKGAMTITRTTAAHRLLLIGLAHVRAQAGKPKKDPPK